MGIYETAEERERLEEIQRITAPLLREHGEICSRINDRVVGLGAAGD